MAAISSLTRSLSAAATTARPIVFGVVGRVAALLPGRSRSPEPTTPETFVPSPTAVDDEPAPTPPAAPSPASIAPNVASPRPSATQPVAKSRSVPGAKLPARRANPST